jgi:hypothetical protein
MWLRTSCGDCSPSLGVIGMECLKGRSMAHKEAIKMLGRLFAIYLCIWVMVDVTYLSDYCFSAWHYLVESSSAREPRLLG